MAIFTQFTELETELTVSFIEQRLGHFRFLEQLDDVAAFLRFTIQLYTKLPDRFLIRSKCSTKAAREDLIKKINFHASLLNYLIANIRFCHHQEWSTHTLLSDILTPNQVVIYAQKSSR